ncbi:MAG TPA: OmpA family protein [Armatimonadota bacterium]|nr:OmpA family protein [Armatimonadota bacterium]
MAREDGLQAEENVNPYIALADLAINLVLILAFFIAAVNAMGRAGWEQVRYRDRQKEFRQSIVASLPIALRPYEHFGKHDPPGVQRWVFSEQRLFVPGTTRITPGGRIGLVKFAGVLVKHRTLWRRVRVEGHTRPPINGSRDDWELSSARAAVVARILYAEGHIPPYNIAVAGRAGQNPIDRSNPKDPRNERVEILLEYAQQETRE